MNMSLKWKKRWKNNTDSVMKKDRKREKKSDKKKEWLLQRMVLSCVCLVCDMTLQNQVMLKSRTTSKKRTKITAQEDMKRTERERIDCNSTRDSVVRKTNKSKNPKRIQGNYNYNSVDDTTT